MDSTETGITMQTEIMPGMCYLDWDCTLTKNHMYHLFSPKKGGSGEVMEMWGNSKTKAKKDAGFAGVVDRLSSQYELWGNKDDYSLQQLEELTRASTPLVDTTDENENLIYDDLKVYLFGDSRRISALDDFIKTASRICGVCILTRGLTGCVYSCLRTYFDHWLQLPKFMIVDYAGICLGPGIQSNTLVTRNLQARFKPKILQIVELEFSVPLDIERKCIFIDDSYKEEINKHALTNRDRMSSRLSFDLWEISFPISSRNGLSLAMNLRIGGTRRNGNGLTTQDFITLKELV